MRPLATLFSLCLLAGALAAQPLLPQRFSGTHPKPVPPEGTLHIQYTNPSRAGTTITIEVHNGADPSQSRDVDVTIDLSGEGSASFDVPPGWVAVVLSYPDSRDLSVVVQDSLPGRAEQSAAALVRRERAPGAPR